MSEQTLQAIFEPYAPERVFELLRIKATGDLEEARIFLGIVEAVVIYEDVTTDEGAAAIAALRRGEWSEVAQQLEHLEVAR